MQGPPPGPFHTRAVPWPGNSRHNTDTIWIQLRYTIEVVSKKYRRCTEDVQEMVRLYLGDGTALKR